MNYLLAAVLTSLLLASACGHGNPPPALETAGLSTSVEPRPTKVRPAAFPGRAALRAQLRSSVPAVREQAAAVGSEIASRALTEAAANAAPSRSPLSKTH